MQVVVLERENYDENYDLLIGLHRLRYRIFKERLGWNVSVAGEMEVDNYDALGPVYLLIVTPEREVIGAARLLPTTGPHMLTDTFSVLLDGAPAPYSEAIWESSRFGIDTRYAEKFGSASLHKVTFMLLAAIAEWGVSNHLRQIVTVVDLRMERILRRAGWPLARIGKPQVIGVTTAVAGTLEVSPAVAARIRSAGGIHAHAPGMLNEMRLAA